MQLRHDGARSHPHTRTTKLLRMCLLQFRVYMGWALTVYTTANELVVLYAMSRRRCIAAGSRTSRTSSTQILVKTGRKGGERGHRRVKHSAVDLEVLAVLQR